jgi:hypothetical protein
MASSQVIKTFPQGIGFEAGFGYSQMRHQVHANPPINEASTHHRDAFFLTPTIRLSYEMYPTSFLPLRTFVGYDISGGKSQTEQNGYQDKYTFQQIELGITVSYSYQRFDFGAGIKYNLHLKVTNEAFGAINDPPGSERNWSETDVTDLFRDNSTDLGIRLDYNIDPVILSFEAWFGMTDLEADDFSELIDIDKKKYLLLIGYQL